MTRGVQKSNLAKMKPFTLGASAADMAMLLLIFFMISTSTEPPKTVPVDLPVGRTEGAEQATLNISISSDGAVYLDGTRTTVAALRDQLALRHGERELPVTITADRNLKYGIISKVLGAAKELGFLNIYFMAQPRD